MEKHAEPPAGCLARAMDCNCPVERQGWNGLDDDLILVSPFTGGKNKAQRGQVTCSRSHSKLLVTWLGLVPSVHIEIRDESQET